MTASSRSLRELFLAALEIPPEDRTVWLERQCAAAGLREQLRLMLAAHDAPHSLLDRPAGLLAASLPREGAGPTLDQPTAGVPGTVNGSYKILEQIGEGGMGTVWMAQQTEPVKRRVAVKLIRAGMDSKQVIARFEAERQALALMDHPNIAKVLDGGTTDTGRPYFVMDLVKGVPITRYCDEHHLTPRQRLELFIPVCQAIQHAHQKGIIHRDLKPSNVLVALYDGKPVPKVIDFGVAKAARQPLTDRTLVTGFGSIVGTLEYMSPEQAEFNQLDIDTRSDVYSLGVLLYELLTGGPPFTRKELETAGMLEILRVIREQEPSKPSTKLSTAEGLPTLAANRGTEPAKLAKLVRGELDWIVMKALEKDRNRRYETANGFAQDVQRYLADEPVLACPPSVGYRLRKFVRRNKAALTTTVLVGAALILAVVVLTVSNVWVAWERDQKGQALSDREDALAKAREQGELARNNAADARKQQGIAESETKRAKAEERTARWHLYTARMNLADQAWREGHIGRALQLLEDQRPEPGQDDPRGFEWYYLWRQCHQGHRLTLRGHRGGVTSVAYSPDGGTLASASYDGTVRLWDALTGRVRATLRGHGSAVHCVAFGPGGDTLATAGSDGTLRLWEVAGLRELAVLQAHAGPVRRAAFSPDGQTLASCGGGSSGQSEPGEVKLWDLATRKERAVFKQEGGTPWSLAFSPDGKRLAQAGGWAEVVLWDVTTGRQEFTLPGDRTGGSNVDITPDGKVLVLGGSTGIVRLWDITSRREVSAFRGHTQTILDVAVSPDGNMVASTSRDGSVRVRNRTAGQTWACGHVGAARSVAFSPDGKSLATAGDDQAIRLWDLDLLEAPSDTEKQVTNPVWCVAFSPDGKTLASGGDARTVKLWDVASGEMRAALPGHAGPILGVTFSPDGKALASTGDDDTIRIWDVATRAVRAVLQTQGTANWSVAFSPDGSTLAVAGADCTARLWDLATKQVRATFKGHTNWVQFVAFSPDGKTLVSASRDGTTKLWNMRTEQVRVTIKEQLGCPTFLPDGKGLASASYSGGVRLWDVDRGQERQSLVPAVTWDDPPRGRAFFFPDCNTAAVGSLDGSVRLWDVATGRERATLKGKAQPIWSLAVSPDGKTMATGNLDGTVRLWRAATEEQVLAESHVRDRREDQAARHTNEGYRLRKAGRLPEAEQAHRQALELCEKLAADHPGIPEYRFQLAQKHFEVAVVLGDAERHDEAEKAYREATGIGEKLIAEFPDDPDYREWLADAHQKMKQWDKAIAEKSKLVQLSPGSFGENNLAWLLATCPDPAFRDGQRAVELAKKAAGSIPMYGGAWNTLGVAHYRAGDCKATIAALDRSMELRNGGNSFDWFFLAMAQWQLNDRPEARKWYDKAVEWMDRNQPDNEELRRFRVEATELLKVGTRKD